MAETEIERDLARRRAEAEIAKLEAEAARARREGRGIGARVGVVVSVATVLTSLVIGGSQVWLAHLKDQNDRRLREVDLGLKTAEFVLAKQDTFLAVSADGQRAFVGLVVDIFPPEDARRVLRRFGRAVTQAGPAAAVCSALTRLGAAADAEALGCTGEPMPVQIAQAPPTAAPPAQPAQPSAYERMERRALAQQRAPDPCADLPDPTERELRVFIHVARDRDRVLLLEHPRALATVPWPIAPIETVAKGTPDQAEIRYYFPDQCRLAVALARWMAHGLEAAGARIGEVGVRYLGVNYRNLPRGRIEVWLPALAP